MPILLRLIFVALVAFTLGAATASLWLVMLRASVMILNPFGPLSTAILVFSVAYTIQTLRRPPR